MEILFLGILLKMGFIKSCICFVEEIWDPDVTLNRLIALTECTARQLPNASSPITLDRLARCTHLIIISRWRRYRNLVDIHIGYNPRWAGAKSIIALVTPNAFRKLY